MIDTLNFYFLKDELPFGKNFSSLQSHFSKVHRSYDDYRKLPCYVGYFHNYKVTSYTHEIKFEGSIAKYFFGNNIQTLNRSTLKDAIVKFCEELNLNPKKAHVRRIDVSDNFEVQHPVASYFPALHYARKYHRVNQYVDEGSLYYMQKNKKMLFYDKLKQLEDTNTLLPENLQISNGTNLLRYEFSIFKCPTGQLKLNVPLTLDMMYDETIYNALIDKWESSFLNVGHAIMLPMKRNIPTKPSGAFDELFNILLTNKIKSHTKRTKEIIDEFLSDYDNNLSLSNMCDVTKRQYKRRFHELVNEHLMLIDLSKPFQIVTPDINTATDAYNHLFDYLLYISSQIDFTFLDQYYDALKEVNFPSIELYRLSKKLNSILSAIRDDELSIRYNELRDKIIAKANSERENSKNITFIEEPNWTDLEKQELCFDNKNPEPQEPYFEGMSIKEQKFFRENPFLIPSLKQNKQRLADLEKNILPNKTRVVNT